MMTFSARKFGLAFCCLFFVISGFPGAAKSETVWERFSEYNADSKVRINHQPLSTVLNDAVFPVGRSYQILGDEKPGTYVNSRIKTSANLNPSRYEANRVMLHLFSDDHEVFFEAYQKGLENLSNRRPLKELNKNEQLAFWLNLHNVIVMNKLIDEYPISKLKSLKGSSKKKGFWDEKVTTVEGVPLSLQDIENIVMHNWDNPVVVYGLWQGSVGGPRLPYQAFNAKNVGRILEDNAEEFVNSNRGAVPKGSAIYASDFYEWVLSAFGNSPDEVLKHIKRYSDSRFHGDISGITQIKFKYYDWQIADLLGGVLHSGATSTGGALLTARGGGLLGDSFDGEMGGAAQTYWGWINQELETPPSMFPPGAQEFLKGAYLNNRRPVYTPNITTDECGPDEENCFEEDIRPVDDEDGDDSPESKLLVLISFQEYY